PGWACECQAEAWRSARRRDAQRGIDLVLFLVDHRILGKYKRSGPVPHAIGVLGWAVGPTRVELQRGCITGERCDGTVRLHRPHVSQRRACSGEPAQVVGVDVLFAEEKRVRKAVGHMAIGDATVEEEYAGVVGVDRLLAVVMACGVVARPALKDGRT